MKKKMLRMVSILILVSMLVVGIVDARERTKSNVSAESDLWTATFWQAAPSVDTSTCSINYDDPELLATVETGPVDPFPMAVGDFNNDGLQDIIVAVNDYSGESNAYPVQIWLNDGNGGIEDRTNDVFVGSVTEPVWVREFAVADFNGDGRDDVYLAIQGDDVDTTAPGGQNRLILSTGIDKLEDASSNLPQQSDFTHSVTSADIDMDGDKDIYVGNISGVNNLPPHMLINDGTGDFTVEARLPSDQVNMNLNKYTSSLFVDVNNDDYLDLVLGDHGEMAIPNQDSVVLLNDGYGYFTTLPNAMPGKLWHVSDVIVDVQAGDITDDGYVDLFLVGTRSSYTGQYIQILINNQDGTFYDDTANRLPQTENDLFWMPFIDLLDLEYDGDLDIVVYRAYGNDSERRPFFINDGNGEFTQHDYEFTTQPQMFFYQRIDLDDDGGFDLLGIISAGGVHQFITARDTECQHTSETRYVRVNGSDSGANTCLDPESPCKTIQYAVDQSLSGDFVYVAEGTYSDVNHDSGLGQIAFINNDIALIGGFDSADWNEWSPHGNYTFLDPQGAGRAIYLNHSNALVQGFEITNGSAEGLSGPYWDLDAGGGIYVVGGAPRIAHNQIYGNGNASFGGGLLLTDSSADVRNNVFSHNNASSGGAIAVFESDDTIANNLIENNSANSGGGIYVWCCQTTISRNRILNNSAVWFGGGLMLTADTSLVSGNVIMNNASSPHDSEWYSGGGGMQLLQSEAHFRNNIIAQNDAGIADGGGVKIRGGDTSFHFNTIADNVSADSSGVTIIANGDTPAIVYAADTLSSGHEFGFTVESGNTLTLEGMLSADSNPVDGTASMSGVFNGAPGFAPFSYHISAQSDAVDRAVTTTAMVDIDGQNRPAGSGHDIGADELWPPIVPPTSSGNFWDSEQTLGSASGFSAAAADVDGDGDIDLYSGNWDQSRRSVASAADKIYLNDGDGVFVDSGQSLGDCASRDVALRDLDGDGDIDAFVTCHGQNLVLFNDGNGVFTQSDASMPNPDGVAMALADLDSDNDLDAVIGNAGNNANTVWLNDGQGYFQQVLELEAGNTEAVALGDVTGNGLVDILFGNFGEANQVWVNNGNGTFSDSGQRLGNAPTDDIVLSDVDADGDMDLIVANREDVANRVWINDGEGNFSDSNQALGNESSSRVAVADLNGDRTPDVVFGNAGPNTVWYNDGSGTFHDSDQTLGNSSTDGMTLADLNGDGTQDVFSVNNGGQTDRVWLNGILYTQFLPAVIAE